MEIVSHSTLGCSFSSVDNSQTFPVNLLHGGAPMHVLGKRWFLALYKVNCITIFFLPYANCAKRFSSILFIARNALDWVNSMHHHLHWQAAANGYPKKVVEKAISKQVKQSVTDTLSTTSQSNREKTPSLFRLMKPEALPAKCLKKTCVKTGVLEISHGILFFLICSVTYPSCCPLTSIYTNPLNR